MDQIILEVVSLTFNRGFFCKECGPIETAKKKTISKVQHNVCPECLGVVKEWERPLKDRDGRCGGCGNASFTSAIMRKEGPLKGHLLRQCKTCFQVVDIDQDCKVIRKGDQDAKLT